jgi:hypothetical protein
MCECPFCTHVSSAFVLPLPVRIPIRPFSHFAAWGWLTSNNGTGRMGIAIIHGAGTRTFFKHSDMVQYIATHFPEVCQSAKDVAQSVNAISVRTSTSTYIPLNIQASLRLPVGKTQMPQPTIEGFECMAQAPPASVMQVPVVKRSNKRLKSAPTAPPSAPRSPTRSERDVKPYSYSIMSIGGNEWEMKRVGDTCPVWDDDTVHYVIDNGGRPPLIDITGRTRMDLFCTFRAPSGDVVRNVCVHRNIIAALYARE